MYIICILVTDQLVLKKDYTEVETEKTYFRSGINFIERGTRRTQIEMFLSSSQNNFEHFAENFWEFEKMRLVQFGELQLDIFQPGGGIDGQRNMA